MNKSKSALLGAAMAGLLSGAAWAKDAPKKMEKPTDLAPCYGINKCKGTGACGGEGHACAGSNECKSQGWLQVPKNVCEKIEGGSLKPLEKKS